MSKLWSRRWCRLAGPFGVIWAAVVVAGFLTPAVAQAAAPTRVSCGVTITADTRLGADLVNCPNNGIVIGAEDNTLDLNGHVVAGDGSRSHRGRRESPATSASTPRATPE